jgi:hypothetical protein
MTRYLVVFDNYGSVCVERPLWREDGWLPNITRIPLYSLRVDRTENSASTVGTCLPNHCITMVAAMTAQNTSHVISSQRIHWCATCCPATSNKHSYFYCCVRFYVFTESLPSNALVIHVTICIRISII